MFIIYLLVEYSFWKINSLELLTNKIYLYILQPFNPNIKTCVFIYAIYLVRLCQFVFWYISAKSFFTQLSQYNRGLPNSPPFLFMFFNIFIKASNFFHVWLAHSNISLNFVYYRGFSALNYVLSVITLFVVRVTGNIFSLIFSFQKLNLAFFFSFKVQHVTHILLQTISTSFTVGF